MATTSQSMFMEDTDDESINTTTTEEDAYDSDQEFAVESILAESHGRDGSFYLIKWESYPLHQASWEPEEKITHKTILDDWTECKRIAQLPEGKPLFDVEEYEDAVGDYAEERERKAKLRRNKRRKRGQILPGDSSASDDDDALPTTAGSKRKHAAVTSPKKRKSLDQAVPQPRKRLASRSHIFQGDRGGSSDFDSLFEEPRRTAGATGTLHTKASTLTTQAAGGIGSNSTATAQSKEPQPARSSTGKTTAISAAGSKAALTAARKSAPSANLATATRTRNVFATDSNKQAKRRQRARVNGDTSRDYDETKFRNLSTQNRYQKYSRNEPAPDINALATVDPKTGRVQPPPAAPKTASSALPSVYGRRTPPPALRRRSRSRSPASLALRQSNSQPSENAGAPPGGNPDRGGIGGGAASNALKMTPCIHFRTGTCRLTADTCPWAHRHITCFFWKRDGQCDQGDRCRYSHWDSGEYAPPPAKLRPSIQPAAIAEHIEKSSMTCYFWRTTDHCEKGDKCDFAHKDTGFYAPPPPGLRSGLELSVLPTDVAPSEMTCFYWRTTDQCTKGDQCQFAHKDTGVHAPPPRYIRSMTDPSAVVNEDDLVLARRNPVAASGYGAPTEPRPFGTQMNVVTPTQSVFGVVPAEVGKRDTTCYFWFRDGDCTKGEGCDFAHRDTGVYAGQPGSFSRNKNVVGTVMDQPGLASKWQNPVSVSGGEALIEQHPSAYPVPSHVSPPPPPPPPLSHMDAAYEAPPPPPPPPPPAETMQNGTAASRAASPPRDPRLRGRAPAAEKGSSVHPSRLAQMTVNTDVVMRSPAHGASATPVTAGASDRNIVMANEAINSNDPRDEGEVDFNMAKRGVKTLDLTALLDVKEGVSIESVFLQIAPNRSQEMEFLKTRFEEFHCKVYRSRIEGHWDFFRNKHPHSLIIVHPTENFKATMPGLYRFLSKNGSAKVYSIGVQRQLCSLEQREPTYEAQQLFPLGAVHFITDDVLVYYPEKATQIIDEFLEKAKAKPVGGELSKIGARPCVLDWVMVLVRQKFEENPKDFRYLRLLDALQRLCPHEDQDEDYHPERSVPIERALLWSEDVKLYDDFTGLWERGDEEAATEYSVKIFACFACVNAARYRRFAVVYQRPGQEKVVESSQGVQEVQQETDPKGWMAKYSHMGVMTADQYLKR